jgi:hypothetical protein
LGWEKTGVWDSYFFGKKLAAWMCHLIEVFGEIGALDVVSWWTSHGASRGKGGLLTDGFWGLWITQFGELFFAKVWGTLR